MQQPNTPDATLNQWLATMQEKRLEYSTQHDPDQQRLLTHIIDMIDYDPTHPDKDTRVRRECVEWVKMASNVKTIETILAVVQHRIQHKQLSPDWFGLSNSSRWTARLTGNHDPHAFLWSQPSKSRMAQKFIEMASDSKWYLIMRDHVDIRTLLVHQEACPQPDRQERFAYAYKRVQSLDSNPRLDIQLLFIRLGSKCGPHAYRESMSLCCKRSSPDQIHWLFSQAPTAVASCGGILSLAVQHDIRFSTNAHLFWYIRTDICDNGSVQDIYMWQQHYEAEFQIWKENRDTSYFPMIMMIVAKHAADDDLCNRMVAAVYGQNNSLLEQKEQRVMSFGKEYVEGCFYDCAYSIPATVKYLLSSAWDNQYSQFLGKQCVLARCNRWLECAKTNLSVWFPEQGLVSNIVNYVG
jgi:hypothetical protein